MSIECECSSCKNACKLKPGWFVPGEAEKVADYLQISLKKLFKTKLAVDFYSKGKEVFVLSPVVVDNNPGKEFPFDPRGQCVFYKDGKCEIHPVKPHECREWDHKMSDISSKKLHENVSKSWEEHQDQIEKLLGKKPVAPEPTFFDQIDMMLEATTYEND
jgi:Fe-S-cluster containining protein